MSQTITTIFFDLGDTLVDQSKEWVAGAKTTLAAARSKGIRLGIISNTGNLSRNQVLDLLPADFDFSRFEAGLVILSSEVGHEKPAKEIFELAVAKAGINGSDCLYCSENLIETLAAQHVGMRAARVLASDADIKALIPRLIAGGLLT